MNDDAGIARSRRGVMLVVSSPSGAGKTTLTRKLIEVERNIELSISVTTRAPRPHERDGRDYHFIDAREFERMREAGELLEWASVFGHSYGTPRRPVIEAVESGRDVLFDIDWQGASQLRAHMGDDVASVFVLPPSAEELERRLVARQQDRRSVIERRLAGAESEIVHWSEYDFVIVNVDFEEAFATLRGILLAERARSRRRGCLADLVAKLERDLARRLDG